MAEYCYICGRKLRDPLAIFCPECEYELKRVRLADEESFEDYVERVREENIHRAQASTEHIKRLDEFFE